jgi:hypothetical protein
MIGGAGAGGRWYVFVAGSYCHLVLSQWFVSGLYIYDSLGGAVAVSLVEDVADGSAEAASAVSG